MISTDILRKYANADTADGHFTLRLGKKLNDDFTKLLKVTTPGMSRNAYIRLMVLEFVAANQHLLDADMDVSSDES